MNYAKAASSDVTYGITLFKSFTLADTGNYTFTKDILDFHKEKMSERGRFENREVSFQMVIDDVYSIGKGYLVGRPK